MPTVSVDRDALLGSLGKEFSEQKFDELCFSFGLEIDDVVVENEGGKEVVQYKVEVAANRYDLLCFEGIRRALLIYLGKLDIPRYTSLKPSETLRLIVKPTIKEVRPFAVAAVLRGIRFTKPIYDSFIDLQDKLHHNIGRKRSLVAIGTHDLDTIQGPFIYEGRKPQDIKFRPLNQTKEFTAVELMELYSTDSHLKPYLPIIRDKLVYPLITDRNGVVLSMPPIINGEHSKISLNTKNIFIESTATSLHRAKIVLDTIVTMFSEHCQQIEAVEVEYDQGEVVLYPELKYWTMEVSVKDACRDIGISISREEMRTLLQRMCIPSTISSDPDKIMVEIPPTRHDILHAQDVYEDVAIAYGYNNVKPTFPSASTIGQQFPLNKLSDQLRHHVAQAGFTEAATFVLCSRDDMGEKLRKTDKEPNLVHVSNPKTLEFQVCRNLLLPGLLKTLAANKKMPLPLQLFEVADIVVKEPKQDVGARNERHLCAVNYNKTPGFEVIHGLLDRVMQLLEIPWEGHGLPSGSGYHIRGAEHASFLPGRCAEIVARGKVVGHLGVLHPDVILAFELHLPCAALEINIEPFL
ncbi:unnamed protein product [Darwinula stevensoni]|uniref:Phenylalanine--tRNA ligase beta subunit n=1 Tax=Darwinula stevensoni TaxID=69355 RepID=A0A7R8X727_9CRUS|nr:unnamed protein product [Darwinula stevensoni]CAG0888646.1 unnamed protein product [Darwinula stevensoni]